MKRKPKKPKKLRMPKPITITPLDVGRFAVVDTIIVSPYELNDMKPRQARKLANWLERAADFLEVQ